MGGEHLTTGWEADVPASDTVLRRNLENVALELEHLATAAGGRIERTDRLLLTDVPSRALFLCRALLLAPLTDERSAAAVVDELERFYGDGPLLLWSQWPTPDLSARLSLMGHPPFMVRMPAPRAGDDPPGLDVVEVDDATSRHDFERVMVDGYPLPDLQPARPGCLLPEASVDGRLRAWVGYAGGRAAACALAFVAAGLVQVEDVATLPAARGRRFGEALTWRATLADPSLPAALVASDLGRPVYERMGYVALTRFTLWFRGA